MKRLNRQEAVMLGLLSALRKDTLRTKLVKLTYLLDHLSFTLTGQTMTQFDYHWDYYGPNAIGNAITERLSDLSQRGLVYDTQKLTPFENYANYYKIGEYVESSEIPLSGDDWSLIHSIVAKYGTLTRPQVVKASKETLPMENAVQFQVLQFEPDLQVEEMKNAFLSDSEFVRLTQEAMHSVSDKISLEEIREEVAQSVDVQ